MAAAQGGGGQITRPPRTVIFKLIYFENLKPTQIGQRLNRVLSNITREIKCVLYDGIYNPLIAEIHLEQRKNQRSYLKMTSEAGNIVKPLLKIRWSTEQIVKWLKTEHPQYTMSCKTIYNYVFFHMKGELKKPELSEYVISTLESALVGGGKKLMLVHRANLDQASAEQGFQLSGEVDD